MKSSIAGDRILKALLEIVGDKFGAEIKAHLEGVDTDGRNVG